jgi:hypothetical protein
VYEYFKLVFVKGDEGPNEFGEMTPQHSSTSRRNSWLLTCVLPMFVIGIWLSLSSLQYMQNAEVGDCLDNNGLLVDCGTAADTNKVISVIEIPDQAKYPGERYFEKYYSRCPTSADWYFYPISESWDLGYRQFLCMKETGQ